jgi:hypothetical protein
MTKTQKTRPSKPPTTREIPKTRCTRTFTATASSPSGCWQIQAGSSPFEVISDFDMVADLMIFLSNSLSRKDKTKQIRVQVDEL